MQESWGSGIGDAEEGRVGVRWGNSQTTVRKVPPSGTAKTSCNPAKPNQAPSRAYQSARASPKPAKNTARKGAHRPKPDSRARELPHRYTVHRHCHGALTTASKCKPVPATTVHWPAPPPTAYCTSRTPLDAPKPVTQHPAPGSKTL